MQQEKACKFEISWVTLDQVFAILETIKIKQRESDKRKPKAKKQSYFDIHFGQTSKSQLDLLTVIV